MPAICILIPFPLSLCCLCIQVCLIFTHSFSLCHPLHLILFLSHFSFSLNLSATFFLLLPISTHSHPPPSLPTHPPLIIQLVEKFLFCGFPMLSVVMVTWVSGMLFGRTVLPYAIAIVGYVHHVAMATSCPGYHVSHLTVFRLIAVSLFVVPLQSSFSKPGMPSGKVQLMGLIPFI